MLDALFAVATWKVALAALAVIVVSTLVLGMRNPKDEIRGRLGAAYVATDNPYKTEKSLWYTTSRVTEMLKLYVEDDYRAHQKFILLYDLIYPLCYGIAGVYLLTFLSPWRQGPARLLVLLPLVMMALDYVENFTMLAVLAHFRRYQQTPLTLLEVSRAFTFAKHMVLFLSLAALIVFFAAFAFSFFRTKPSAS
jgi:hypothetical protein